MAKQGLSNRLIGRTIKPSQSLLNESDLRDRIWGLKPNLSNEYFGVVEAAWLEEGHVKVLVSGPMGDIKEIYMHDHLIEITDIEPKK